MKMESHTFIVLGILTVLIVMLWKWFRRSFISVNCWFCNLNCSVPVKMLNKWTCYHCDQYNGFRKDGDYNCEIKAHSDEALNRRNNFCSVPGNRLSAFQNGLCFDCNHNQEKKIALLTSFEPINPKNYDKEIDLFRENLDRAYRLCSNCELVLEETLSRKKTLVLASNLNLSVLRADNFKQVCFKKKARAVLSVVTSVLAATLAFSSTLYVYSTFFVPSDSPNYSAPFISFFSSKRPLFYLHLSSCPVETSHAIRGNANPEKLNHAHWALNSYLLPVAVGLLCFQCILTCYTRHSRILLLMCLAQVFILSLQHMKYYVASYFVGVQAALSWTILLYYLAMTSYKKSRTAVPLKRLRNVTVKPLTSIVQDSKRTGKEKHTESSWEAPLEAPLDSLCKLPHSNVPSLPLQAERTLPSLPNYLTLPVRPPTSQESRPSSISPDTSSPSRRSNSPLMLPFDHHSVGSQEDARSDASVDSAFSNADSSILDSAEMVGSAVDCDPERTQDVEVQSLINSLSLGTRQKTQITGHVFTTKRYGRNKKSHMLLKPSKLDDALHDSWNSSMWPDTIDQSRRSASAFVPVSDQRSNLRSISPAGSEHSQVTQNSLLSESAISPSGPRLWNQSSTLPNGLAIAVPPQSPFTSFGSHAFFPSPQVPHVVYTSYGLNNQPFSPIWNPAFTMSHQSPYLFGSSSPPRFAKSQAKNGSFRSSGKLEMDSEEDIDASTWSQSSYSKRPDVNLSSSFIDSVWQSRSVIIYTTACYVALGSMVIAYYHKNWILDLVNNFQLILK